MNNTMKLNTKITLNNGVQIPILGLGTWKIGDSKVEEIIPSALNIGYRHIDTAATYQNEVGAGKEKMFLLPQNYGIQTMAMIKQ